MMDVRDTALAETTIVPRRATERQNPSAVTLTHSARMKFSRSFAALREYGS